MTHLLFGKVRLLPGDLREDVTLDCDVRDRGDGHYEMNYTVNDIGRYELSVLLPDAAKPHDRRRSERPRRASMARRQSLRRRSLSQARAQL